jgi:D-aspartate ligase
MIAASGGVAELPVLLADASWWGTLAAARDLGRRGIAVTVASDDLFAPTRWSRHIRRFVRSPPTADRARFVDWLLDFGSKNPRHVLCATSDETAWSYTAHAEELSRWFLLASPPLHALSRLLDKVQLAGAGRAAGLEVLETWCPRNDEEAWHLGETVQVPLFLKPRAQLFATGAGKGRRVEGAEALLRLWRAQRQTVTYPADVRARIPGVELPVVQTYRAAGERIYTVDGFIDRSGEAFVTRACVKLLQRPRGGGPGIVFVDAPVLDSIARGLQSLFRSVGFHGPFDVEFLEDGDRKLLIDVNPRFYNHMAFEVDRGLPLAWLSYLEAKGDGAALERAVGDAQRVAGGPRRYVHHLPLSLMMLVQRLLGRIAPEERRAWRTWLDESSPRVTNPARAPDDPGPAVAALALELVQFLRHPRSYLRALAHAPPTVPETASRTVLALPGSWPSRADPVAAGAQGTASRTRS